MSYNPSVSFRGDQYIAAGISSAGKSVAGAIKANKDFAAERDYFAGFLRELSGFAPNGKPVISPEEMQKIEGMSLPQQKAVAAEKMMVLDHELKQATAAQDFGRDTQRDLYRATLENQLKEADAVRNEPQSLRMDGTFVPGMGWNPKTGQIFSTKKGTTFTPRVIKQAVPGGGEIVLIETEPDRFVQQRGEAGDPFGGPGAAGGLSIAEGAELERLKAENRDHEVQISSGDLKSGFLGFQKDRLAQIKANDARIAELEGRKAQSGAPAARAQQAPAAAAPAPSAPPPIKVTPYKGTLDTTAVPLPQGGGTPDAGPGLMPDVENLRREAALAIQAGASLEAVRAHFKALTGQDY